MSRQRTVSVLVVVCIGLLAVLETERLLFAHQETEHGADAAGALPRFLAGPDVAIESYRAVRRLTASNKRYHASAWLEVAVTLDPRDGFSYDVIREGGSDYIRGRVLRRVLVEESEAYRSANNGRAALTFDNYEFRAGAVGPDGLIQVPIVPRRRESLLIDGFILLGADGELVQIEGRLARNPSFWTRRVDIVRRYGRVNGVRVPLEMSSTAHVVLAGVSSFSMCYDYEAVNGVAVDEGTTCS